jgi:endo-1,4-beta-mannosidase
MRVCGLQFCYGSTAFYPFGATFYRSSPLSGIDNPAGAVALAQLEGLNTIRIVNFYNPTSGDPTVTPFSNVVWDGVDTLIADAQAGGIKVVLDLADYRNILMDHCINPYTYDWTALETFVTHRVNHVTGRTYATDPEIAMVSFSGEPLPVGTHGCISYTTQNLTDYFHSVTRIWKSMDPNHVVTSGGLGYLDFNSGIDWQAIDADPNADACGFKTYGGILQWVHIGAAYCNGTLHKPWFDDEWGYQQSGGDPHVSSEFGAQFANNAANGAAANFFWNAGYQVAATTYDVGPQMPLTMAIVRRNAHPPAP